MSLPRPAPLARTPDNHRAVLRRRRAEIQSIFNKIFGLAMSAAEEWKEAEREGKGVADELAMTKTLLESSVQQVEQLRTEVEGLKKARRESTSGLGSSERRETK